MAYERAVKRMDQAVASSWLRGLRSQGRTRIASTEPRLRAGASRAVSLGKVDRQVAAVER